MALEHHIDVVLVKDGGELCAEDQAVGVGVDPDRCRRYPGGW